MLLWNVGADPRANRRAFSFHASPSKCATVLDVYGHLFYAGARTLEKLLPSSAHGAESPVVILRLRGRAILGATD
jgi:hypothetical protein